MNVRNLLPRIRVAFNHSDIYFRPNKYKYGSGDNVSRCQSKRDFVSWWEQSRKIDFTVLRRESHSLSAISLFLFRTYVKVSPWDIDRAVLLKDHKLLLAKRKTRGVILAAPVAGPRKREEKKEKENEKKSRKGGKRRRETRAQTTVTQLASQDLSFRNGISSYEKRGRYYAITTSCKPPVIGATDLPNFNAPSTDFARRNLGYTLLRRRYLIIAIL